MAPYLERAINIKREEFAPAALLFLYLFLVIGCYIMGQAVGDALFLSAFPTFLPQAIIATAIVVGIFTSLYIRLSRRFPLEQLIIGSLLFFAGGFLFFWTLTRIGGAWLYPCIFVWVYMTGALAPAMGWTLANCSLTTREARRVFGFIGAGAILGAPTAGFLTADLTRRSHLRPETLLLFVAIGLGLSGLSVKLLFRHRRHRLADLTRAPASATELPGNLRQVWSHIRASRYLLLITALIMVGCITTTIIGYQFKLIAYQSFHTDRAALAAFFGRFYGYIGLASFVLQMLFTGRLLRSFGIRVMLFLMPLVFLGGSLAVLLAPALLTACILKGSQNLLRYSVDKSTTELLYLPVAPPAVKSQVKSFIDGFVWRMADGLGGIVLFVFGNKLDFSPGRISLLSVVFLFSWITIAYGVRREYLTVLRKAIERRKLNPERIAARVLDSTTAEVLARSLERGGEQQVLYGLSLFEVGRESAWHPILSGLLDHPSASVRQKALHLLTHAPRQRVLPQVEKMLGDEALEVRAEALHYLVVHAHMDPLHLLATASDVQPHCLQSAVVVHLARTRDPDCAAAARYILDAMLSTTGPAAGMARREAARAVGAIPGPSEFHDVLFKLLRDENLDVVEQALLSAGRIRVGEFLPLILERLAQPQLLGAARAALAQYGDKAVGLLQDGMNDGSTPACVRKQVPKVLVRIGTPRAAAVLSRSLIQTDPDIRYEVIKALNKIRARDPSILTADIGVSDMLGYELIAYCRSLQVLSALDGQNTETFWPTEASPLVCVAVRERMEQNLERIFRLLGLLYSAADMHNAYLGLVSDRPQLQANALEVLEHLIAPALYRRLIAVIDPDHKPAERLAIAERLSQTSIDSPTEALRVLLHSGDCWLCACALYSIGQGRVGDLDSDVRQLSLKEPLLDDTWKWAKFRLATGKAVRGTKMLSIVEKVDLLRRAAIFQDIPTQSLARVAAIATEVSWATHQMVYQENNPAESLFFLLHGEVELRGPGNAFQRKGEEEAIGGLAALAMGSYTESAVALQPTRALRIDREDFLEAMAEDFDITRGVLKALTGMARGAADRTGPQL